MTLPKDVESDERNHWVYRVFDREGRLLYVGCSKHLGKRWKEHYSNRSAWLPYARSRRLTGPFTYRQARYLEREAIWGEAPIFNHTGPRQSLKQRHYAHRSRGRGKPLTPEERAFLYADRRYLRGIRPAAPSTTA